MVLISVIRQTAARRIPLIKFRRQREEEATAARSGISHSHDSKGTSSSPAAVSLLLNCTKVLRSVDWYACFMNANNRTLPVDYF